MKILLISALCVIMTACSGNNGQVPGVVDGDSTQAIEVSNLSITPDVSVTPDSMDFGITTSASPIITKILTFKNSSTNVVSFSVALSLPVNGFSIKLNRCSSSLLAKSSCQVTVAFASRGLFDGDQPASLNVVVGTSSNPLNLVAHVSGQPNPDSSGTPLLSVSLNSDFVPLNSIPTRVLTVKNIGTGTATTIAVQLTAEFSVWTNHCASNLKPGDSCEMQIAFKKARLGIDPAGLAPLSITSNAEVVSLDLIPPLLIGRAAGSLNGGGNIIVNDPLNNDEGFGSGWYGSRIAPTVNATLKTIVIEMTENWRYPNSTNFHGAKMAIEIYADSGFTSVNNIPIAVSDAILIDGTLGQLKFKMSQPLNLAAGSLYHFIIRGDSVFVANNIRYAYRTMDGGSTGSFLLSSNQKGYSTFVNAKMDIFGLPL